MLLLRLRFVLGRNIPIVGFHVELTMFTTVIIWSGNSFIALLLMLSLAGTFLMDSLLMIRRVSFGDVGLM